MNDKSRGGFFIEKNSGQKKYQKILMGLFIIYLVMLVWIILFKFSFSIGELEHIRNINFVPFKGAMITNGKINFSEMYMNMFIFAPFGVYLGVLFPNWKGYGKVFTVFFASVILEVLQYILAIGRTDITDVINNTLGGLVGLLVYVLIGKAAKSEERARGIVFWCALVGTILMLALIGIVYGKNGVF